MNPIFCKIAKLSHILPFNFLIKVTGQKLVLPFYHTVSNIEVAHIKHLYKVRTPKAFENDLDFMLKHYKPIDYACFIDGVKNKKAIKQKSFLLSFDDGLREFYDIIAPILKRKGIPAMCFLNSAFIDNKELFFRYKESLLVDKIKTSSITNNLQKKLENWFLEKNMPKENISKSILSINYTNKHYLENLASLLEVDFQEYLQTNQPYLNTDQIKSLINQGFVFGAHSIDHPQFSEINESQQLFQIKTSIDEITSKFNLKYRIFSFPFTDFEVSKSFFENVFIEKNPVADITFGCAGLKQDCCVENIQRIPIEIDNMSAKEVLYSEYLYYILKKVFNKNSIKRT